MKSKKRGAGTLNVNLTVCGSAAVAVSTYWGTSEPQRTLAPYDLRVVKVYATSSAVNGLPSLQLMSLRILTVSCLKSGVYSYDSAVQRISLLANTEKYANGSKMIWFMLDVSEPTVYGLQMSGLYSLPSRPVSAVIRMRLRGTSLRPA